MAAADLDPMDWVGYQYPASTPPLVFHILTCANPQLSCPARLQPAGGKKVEMV